MDVAAIPDKYKPMYWRAMDGKSRQSAIRFHCLECVNFNEHEVELCSSPTCSLYPYRHGAPHLRGGAGDLEATQ
jgi:hypothetical protein